METKEVKNGFTLPEESVIIKFIKRKRGMAANVDDTHVISGGMLTNAKKKFYAPLQSNGAIANILTKEEKEHLEQVTGLNLSVYGDFWKDFSVSLYKDEHNNKFDLSNPMDYISLRLLEAYRNDIALQWADRNKKQTYQFVITRPDEVQNEKKIKLDVKKLAFKMYGKIEDDKDKLLGVLKLLTNQPISKESSLEWIQGKVEEYVDTMPSSFIGVIDDPSFDTKVLLNKGIDSGVVIRKSNKYSTIDGLDLCERDEIATFDNAVRYLDNDKNQEVRSLIEAKIENSK